jgi:hypothetical protein
MRYDTFNRRRHEVGPQEKENPEIQMNSTEEASVRLMLAYLCVATEKEASIERKVEILDRFALTDAEIAKVCKSAVQSIRNARHSLSKHGKKHKTKK